MSVTDIPILHQQLAANTKQKGCCSPNLGMASNEILVKLHPHAVLAIMIYPPGRPTKRVDCYSRSTMMQEDAVQASQIYQQFLEKRIELPFYLYDEREPTYERALTPLTLRQVMCSALG